ncbi:MAG: hypothetical protein ACREH5_08515 [Candidatus Omnitrophota bacterium]
MLKTQTQPRPPIRHKWFFLACFLIVAAPFLFRTVSQWVLSRAYLTQKIILVAEGERPVDSNFYDSVGMVSTDRRFFGGQSLQLSTPIAVDGGYFSRYEIDIPEDAEYRIFVAGTPPGPAIRGVEWHSPYAVAIDGQEPRFLTEEALKKEWPSLFQFSYASGGYYFTRIATEKLSKGRHRISFFIRDRRKHDGHFTLYLDAVLFVPKDFEPKTNVGRIPKALFYE